MSGIASFERFLDSMRKARRDLRSDCIGPDYKRMVAKVRGADVLIWPERFAQCEAHAKLLSTGGKNFEDVMQRTWNPFWKASYKPPVGDPVDLQAWQERKSSITHFQTPGCDDASRAIVLSGEPGLAATPAQVFEKMKGVCGTRWVELFEPDEASAKRQKEAKERADAKRKICAPGTSYTEISESGKSREVCDESDKVLPEDLKAREAERNRKKADLEADLAHIGAGGYKNRPSGELSDEKKDLQAALKERFQMSSQLLGLMLEDLKKMPSAGSIGGVEIFGGETGRQLEQALTGGSGGGSGGAGIGAGAGGAMGTDDVGCDQAAYAAQAQTWVNSQSRRIASMSTSRQQCELAKINAQALRSDIAFAQRCGFQSSVPQLRSALADTERQQRSLCSP